MQRDRTVTIVKLFGKSPRVKTIQYKRTLVVECDALSRVGVGFRASRKEPVKANIQSAQRVPSAPVMLLSRTRTRYLTPSALHYSSVCLYHVASTSNSVGARTSNQINYYQSMLRAVYCKRNKLQAMCLS